MLSKPATMLLGLINEKPLNAYEIIKVLEYMNVKYWFNIADSTVYTTIKTLEKRGLILGTVKKDGNMPDKTVYTITEKGSIEFHDTLRSSILKFDYDTNIFSITAFFIEYLGKEERKKLLEKRLEVLNQYLTGIKQKDDDWEKEVSEFHVANVKRMIDIVLAEISGTKKLLTVCKG
ncbi:MULTISPECIES: PadR family transcriptional regulator [unclassified Clostridioides]|uniref:PadR family transcriptional regulator n=1 Tax=unclassified Clostridioides TaxID=2635829 RepID=UPI001D0C56C5|nr:PadR family transcriptional regulator [Clostridioides sp. ES-S-0001-02]MCC0702258.1 PadR family transcriptional regulator [Clostridioides sp. ES-S-0049-02]MCC0763971.1 PadR family transcriptional regulator [Clostridioides sp. ES-S-0006-03]